MNTLKNPINFADYDDSIHIDFIDNSLSDIPLCSGFGQFHTHEPDPKKPQKRLTHYLTIGCDAIRVLVDTPQQADKTKSQWLIASNLLSRNFKVQEAQGEFWLLWG